MSTLHLKHLKPRIRTHTLMCLLLLWRRGKTELREREEDQEGERHGVMGKDRWRENGRQGHTHGCVCSSRGVTREMKRRQQAGKGALKRGEGLREMEGER